MLYIEVTNLKDFPVGIDGVIVLKPREVKPDVPSTADLVSRVRRLAKANLVAAVFPKEYATSAGKPVVDVVDDATLLTKTIDSTSVSLVNVAPNSAAEDTAEVLDSVTAGVAPESVETVPEVEVVAPVVETTAEPVSTVVEKEGAVDEAAEPAEPTTAKLASKKAVGRGNN